MVGFLSGGCGANNGKSSSLNQSIYQPCTTDIECSHIGEYCNNGTCADLPTLSLCEYKTHGVAVQELYDVNLKRSGAYLRGWYPTGFARYCTPCADGRPGHGKVPITKLVTTMEY